MEQYDLEVGPVQRTFDNLFRSINNYFQSEPVAPQGSITETDLSSHSQKNLRDTLNSSLKHYGFTNLPHSLKITAEDDSYISGIHRSDNITVYDEKLSDGSHRTFNFYSALGPENMKASFYWLDKSNGGEQIQGVFTKENVWYFRITTSDNAYYLRVEEEKPERE